ncbi:LytTR family DNA-binding domain-containing protein [bacterium]|nr:LytTR family DNA-binding domain-containing protein [bacterium]
MTYKALIVDDERLARREMRLMLANHSEIQVIGEADDLASATAAVERYVPDVIFLDIQLAGESGFDLLERLSVPCKIIFVTAFDVYAIRAFEVNALDYLLKPVSAQRLDVALRRLKNHETVPHHPKKFEYDDRLFIADHHRSFFLKIRNILYIQSAGDYTEITAQTGKFLLSKTMKEWEDRLPEKYFLRIHRGTMINLELVDRVEPLPNQSYHVYIHTITEPFVVSRRYATKIKAVLR